MGPRGAGRSIDGGPIPATALFTVALWGVAAISSATAPSLALAQQSAARAPAVLAAVSGTPPVACDLVVQALGNRFSAPSVRPRVNVPGGPELADRELLDWAGTGRLGPENAAPLLEALGSDDACVRRVAARLVSLVDDATVPARLAGQLQRPEPLARLAAIQALSYVRSTASAEALAGVLRGSDPALKRAAAWALASMGSSTQTAGLSAALRDPDVPLRENAAWALGRLRDQTAVPALIAALEDASAGVRVNAAWSLGQLANVEAVPALAEVLASDADIEVRTTAAWALGRMRSSPQAPR